MNTVGRLFLSAFMAGVVFFFLFLVWPRDYPVQPMSSRPGARYWELPGGSRIAYTLSRAKGKKKPYPLIYLHGGPGAGVTDREISILSRLSADGYDVYLYDQVGCGRSGRLGDIREYHAERHCRDLGEIVNLLGARKVILIAQSWGSILSVLYLTQHPDRVERIIVTAPGDIQPPRKELESLAPPDSLHLRSAYTSPLYHRIIAGDLKARLTLYAARKFGMKLSPDAEADRFLTHATNELNKMMVCDTANAVQAESTEGFYTHYLTLHSLRGLQDPRPTLRGSPVPVRILKGECDNGKWGYTAEYLELFPDHRLTVVAGAGHNIFIEQPERYLELIRGYLPAD